MVEDKLRNYVSEDGTYVIPVMWSMYSAVTVHAANLAEALAVFKEKMDELPLSDAEYVDGSYDVVAEDADALITAQGYSAISDVTIYEDGSISS